MAYAGGTIKDPVTKDDLIEALRRVGVTGSQIIEVHSSLSSFGNIIGGARTVVDALMEVNGRTGTILMPTQTTDNSEPSRWMNPPVQPSVYEKVRNAIPAYDSSASDLRDMGAVVENFRRREGVCCSEHPSVSYAAWGRYAKLLCNRQSLHFPFAEESPCARLYELKGYVLLLGTDFDTATCLHLAEYRCDCRTIQINGAAVETENGREWKKYLDLDINSDDFLKIRPIMARKNMIRETTVGNCRIQFFSAAAAIDEATKYFEQNTVYDLYR